MALPHALHHHKRAHDREKDDDEDGEAVDDSILTHFRECGVADAAKMKAGKVKHKRHVGKNATYGSHCRFASAFRYVT